MESIPSHYNSAVTVVNNLLGNENKNADKSQTVVLVNDDNRFSTKAGRQENIFSSQGISLRAIGQAIIASVYWRPSTNKATYDALKKNIQEKYPNLDKDQDFSKHFYYSQKLGLTLTKGALVKFVNQQLNKGLEAEKSEYWNSAGAGVKSISSSQQGMEIKGAFNKGGSEPLAAA